MIKAIVCNSYLSFERDIVTDNTRVAYGYEVFVGSLAQLLEIPQPELVKYLLTNNFKVSIQKYPHLFFFCLISFHFNHIVLFYVCMQVFESEFEMPGTLHHAKQNQYMISKILYECILIYLQTKLQQLNTNDQSMFDSFIALVDIPGYANSHSNNNGLYELTTNFVNETLQQVYKRQFMHHTLIFKFS